jgi:hypothetical protein
VAFGLWGWSIYTSADDPLVARPPNFFVIYVGSPTPDLTQSQAASDSKGALKVKRVIYREFAWRPDCHNPVQVECYPDGAP